jgi:hypothetical protein
MGNQYVVRKPAIYDDAQRSAWCAQLLFSAFAGSTFAAANPWKHYPTITKLYVTRIRTDCHHFAEDFMAKHHTLLPDL